jgi:DNA primase
MTSPFDFDLIQAAHPLAEFCESRGIELRKRGFVRQGLCPLHEEDSASFTVYPDNHYYCFGCGRHGDVVDLLAALDQLSIKDAAHKLSASSSGPESASRQSKQPVKPYELTNEDIERMASAAHRLAANEGLIERLARDRPGWTTEAIRGAALDGDLGWEGGRLLFGYCHGIKARWTDTRGKRVIRWLCGGAAKECWRQSLIVRKVERILITEGETDAITLLGLGCEQFDPPQSRIVALPSAGAQPHFALFKGRDVVLFPDPDTAGENTVETFTKLIKPLARRFGVVRLEVR